MKWETRPITALIGSFLCLILSGCNVEMTSPDPIATEISADATTISASSHATEQEGASVPASSGEEPVEPSSGGELETGTITGNPVPKPIRQLILKTVDSTDDAGGESVAASSAAEADGNAKANGAGDAALSEGSSVASSDTPSETSDDKGDVFSEAVSDSYAYCHPKKKYLGESLPGVRGCAATPSQYNMGVREIAFTTCLDEAGAEAPCRADLAAYAAAETAIFQAEEGRIRRMEVDETGTGFAFDMGENAAIHAGGIRFTVSYVEQKLPDEDSDPEEAEKIMPALRGTSYRVCTASQDAGTAAMTEYCGQPDARMGDVLWDVDGDGNFAFWSPAKGAVAEVTPRPVKYASMNVLSILEHVTEGNLDPLVQGGAFLSLLAGFDAVTDVAADEEYSATVTFDVAKTFRFIDGHTNVIKCELKGDMGPCESNDNDPWTAGFFNPLFDSFLPALPDIDVTDLL